MAKLSFDMESAMAAFKAKGGTVKVVDAGARSMTERDVYRAIGYEPEKLTVYYIALTQETGENAVETISAENKYRAEEKANANWPECRVYTVYNYEQYERAKELGMVHGW